MRRAALFALLVAGLVTIVALPAAGSPSTPASGAKACKAGYRHAVVGGAHKCLKAGQNCTRRLDRTYHRYGFHCHGGRLTRIAPPKPKPLSADLTITKTVSAATVTVGDSLTYTLTVTNNGPDTAADVVLSDVLPSTVTVEGGTSVNAPAPDCSGLSPLRCSFGAMASGRTHAISVAVRTRAAGSLSNTATVSSPTRDPNAANNSSTVTTTVNAPPTPQYALTVAKAGSGAGTVASTPTGIGCGSLCS